MTAQGLKVEGLKVDRQPFQVGKAVLGGPDESGEMRYTFRYQVGPQVSIEDLKFFGCENVSGIKRKARIQISFSPSEAMGASVLGFLKGGTDVIPFDFDGRCSSSPCELTIVSSPARAATIDRLPMTLRSGKQTVSLDLASTRDIAKAGVNNPTFVQSLLRCVNAPPQIAGVNFVRKVEVKKTGDGPPLSDIPTAELSGQ